MNKIRYLILIITGIVVNISRPLAQQTETEAGMLPPDSITDIYLLDYFDDEQLTDSLEDILPESMDVDWQKLFEGWHASNFYSPEVYCIDDNVNPFFPDSVYRMRLERMPVVIPMTYNETVRRYIDYYAVRNRMNVRYFLGMADYFFPMFEQKLDAHGLPLELKYLSIVESALKPTALSRVGASGLWQFMLPTGKSYGLEINSLIDERFDPEKATEAACMHLKKLYNMYDDWYLALAAYNSGEGNVNRAIARSGGKKDYWKITSYLPRETRAFVPLYIAASYIMTYHCEHNICPVRSNFSVATDTIMVERALHFDQIAEIMQIDKEAIRFYNPQYKREIIPGNVQPSVLRLPIANTIDFINQADSIYAHRVFELLEYCIPVDANDPKSRQELISHTVKPGENVNTIANLYGVTMQELRRWNGLSASARTVAQGRKLRVYIDNGGLTFSAPVTASATTSSTQQKPATANASSNTGSSSGYTTYQVKKNDTLSAIALKYPGVTWQNIQQANGMKTTALQIGQVLKIPQR